MSNFRTAGINLDTYFQLTSPGCITAAATNIRNIGTDLNRRYAGRDNLATNAVTAIASTGYRVGGTDIVSRFNRSGAVFNVAITGVTTYTGSGQTASIQSFTPSNVVTPNILGTVTNANTYGPGSFTIGTNIPSTYTKSLSGTYIIQKRQPYIPPLQFQGPAFNDITGQTYNLYWIISNIVDGTSVTLNVNSGDVWFFVAGEWTQTTKTSSSTENNPFANIDGIINFAIGSGGGTFSIVGTSNYESFIVP